MKAPTKHMAAPTWMTRRVSWGVLRPAPLPVCGAMNAPFMGAEYDPNCVVDDVREVTCRVCLVTITTRAMFDLERLALANEKEHRA